MRFNSKKYIMIPTIFSRITQIHLRLVKQAGVQAFGFCFHRQALGKGKNTAPSVLSLVLQAILYNDF